MSRITVRTPATRTRLVQLAFVTSRTHGSCGAHLASVEQAKGIGICFFWDSAGDAHWRSPAPVFTRKLGLLAQP